MKSKTALRMLSVSALLAFTGLPGCSSDDNKSTNVVQTTEPFESGDISNGGIFVHTFGTAGSFSYRCRHHGGMTGTVTVAASGVDSPSVAISDNYFNPSTATVKPGGYVKWVKGVGNIHTVTRP